jgi:ubiquinone/menaquinone biosynthesis C-methylase UbiE
MAEVKVTFDAADDYERFMGRWSRAIGEKFLMWMAPPAEGRWLDVGCGTGAFSERYGTQQSGPCAAPDKFELGRLRFRRQ